MDKTEYREDQFYNKAMSAKNAFPPEQPVSMTGEIIQRAMAIREDLASAIGDLSMLRERTFGEGTAGSASNTSQPRPAGSAGEITATLEELKSQAGTLCNVARELNSRI